MKLTFRTLRLRFQAKLETKPVREIETKNRGRVTVGLIVPEMVSLLEEHASRRESGYTIPEWRELSPQERALEVALRRTMNKIETIEHELDDEERKMKAKRK